MAGIAASKTYGVAKKATVWGVKVLDCDGWGSTATILDAMDVVSEFHQSPAVLTMSLGMTDSPPSSPFHFHLCVLVCQFIFESQDSLALSFLSISLFCSSDNPSILLFVSLLSLASSPSCPKHLSPRFLGGPRSRIMDKKATILTETENVLIVVAAGNDNKDACSQSPARNGGVITVGASTNQDARASFSNYGRCLDLFAPGLNIRSLSSHSDTGQACIDFLQ